MSGIIILYSLEKEYGLEHASAKSDGVFTLGGKVEDQH